MPVIFVHMPAAMVQSRSCTSAAGASIARFNFAGSGLLHSLAHHFRIINAKFITKTIEWREVIVVKTSWITVAGICALPGVNISVAEPLSLAPAAMPAIGTVDHRYQSFNVEMVEVVGGSFGKPYDKKSLVNPGSGPARPESNQGASTPGSMPQQFG